MRNSRVRKYGRVNPRLSKFENSTIARAARRFGVRELGPAFSAADSSAVGETPRRVAARESGDESPHSETGTCTNRAGRVAWSSTAKDAIRTRGGVAAG